MLPGGKPLLISGMFAIPTSAQLGASEGPSLADSPSQVRPGGSVALSGGVGSRCAAGARVMLASAAFTRRDGVRAVESVVGRDGLFVAFATVSGAATAGRYAVTARCGGRKLDTVAHLRVRA